MIPLPYLSTIGQSKNMYASTRVLLNGSRGFVSLRPALSIPRRKSQTGKSRVSLGSRTQAIEGTNGIKLTSGVQQRCGPAATLQVRYHAHVFRAIHLCRQANLAFLYRVALSSWMSPKLVYIRRAEAQSEVCILAPCEDPCLHEETFVKPLPAFTICPQKWLIGNTESVASEITPIRSIEPEL